MKFELEAISEDSIVIRMEGERLEFKRSRPTVRFESAVVPPRREEASDSLVSPMPGKVISIRVKEGQPVKEGDPLMILESMKMESVLRSDRRGIVGQVLVAEGASVKRGQRLLNFA